MSSMGCLVKAHSHGAAPDAASSCRNALLLLAALALSRGSAAEPVAKNPSTTSEQMPTELADVKPDLPSGDAALAWINAAKSGRCGATREVDGGDCESGNLGSWALDTDVATWQAAVHSSASHAAALVAAAGL